MADAAAGQFLEGFDLAGSERAGGCDDDGLAGVDAQGVEVFHGCDGEAVVIGVAYDLELYLLPSLQALFDQYLVGEGKGALGQAEEGFLVGADATALAAEGVG